MAIFPQLSTGQVTSIPFQRSPRYTTSVNRADDGTEFRYAELQQELGAWQIDLNNLPDADLIKTLAFFNANLKYGRFIFLDPFQNLLQYSEDYTQSAWNTTGFTAVQPPSGGGALPGPIPGTLAGALLNTSGSNKTLSQQIPVGPASQTMSPFPNMWFTASVWLQGFASGSPSSATLQISDGISQVGQASLRIPLDGRWYRYSVSFNFLSSASSTLEWDLVVPSSGTYYLYTFGAQLMYLPGMGDYTKTTTVTGVRPVCRFDTDTIQPIGTTFGASKVTLPIVELVG